MSPRDNLTGITDTSVTSDWGTEAQFWRNNFTTRPYVNADQGFDFYEPGFRYGFESAHRHTGRSWQDVEDELRSGWDDYTQRGERSWDHVKGAVRDAWDRARR